jgi:hypothetical protein
MNAIAKQPNMNQLESIKPLELESVQGVQANALMTRTLAELQASVMLSKAHPRSLVTCERKILEGVERFSLAERAEYSLPIGGKPVTGASIHLIQHIARCYGNIDFGVRQLAVGEDVEGSFTDLEAYAWDKEDNIRVCNAFRVYHFMLVKDYKNPNGPKVKKHLNDVGDVNRLIGSYASRQVRGVLARVLPADLIDMALEKSKETLRKGEGAAPLIDRVKKCVNAFAGLGVDQASLETEAKVKIEFWTESILADMRGRYTALKDGEATREALFSALAPATQSKAAEEVAGKLGGAK